NRVECPSKGVDRKVLRGQPWQSNQKKDRRERQRRKQQHGRFRPVPINLSVNIPMGGDYLRRARIHVGGVGAECKGYETTQKKRCLSVHLLFLRFSPVGKRCRAGP